MARIAIRTLRRAPILSLAIATMTRTVAMSIAMATTAIVIPHVDSNVAPTSKFATTRMARIVIQPTRRAQILSLAIATRIRTHVIWIATGITAIVIQDARSNAEPTSKFATTNMGPIAIQQTRRAPILSLAIATTTQIHATSTPMGITAIVMRLVEFNVAPTSKFATTTMARTVTPTSILVRTLIPLPIVQTIRIAVTVIYAWSSTRIA